MQDVASLSHQGVVYHRANQNPDLDPDPVPHDPVLDPVPTQSQDHTAPATKEVG